MTKNIPEKDKEDWENFIESKEKLPNKDLEKQNKIPFTTRSIDLHGFTLEQANSAIENFINEYENNWYCFKDIIFETNDLYDGQLTDE